MARTRQLIDLRNDAYQFADTQNALARFPVSEVNQYICQGVANLYDVLVASNGNYFESQATIVTDGVSTVYALPADYMRLLLCQMNIGNFQGVTGFNVPLPEFNLNERPVLSSSTPGFSGFAFAYRVHGGTTAQPGTTQSTINVNYGIEFLPRPSANIQILLFYVPSCPLLVNDTDTLDTINGWDHYASLYAAKCMKQKDDLDTRPIDSMMADIKVRIQGMAPHRNVTAPTRINDTRGQARMGRGRRGGRGNGWGGL